MDLIQAVVLALVQGLTEILPVSSSGHLVLVPHFLGWADQGLAFDVALHVGTLFAVVWYFRRDLSAMVVSGLGTVQGKPQDAASRLAWRLVLATIPAALIGLWFQDAIEQHLRSPLVIVCTLTGFGLLLGLSDWLGRGTRSEYDTTWRDALLIGCAQALALVPGTSRSGVTMTAGRMLGMSRIGAARFSFLMSVPVVALAGGYKLLQLVMGPAAVDWTAMGIGMVVAFASALLSIRLLLGMVQRFGFWPFVVYRLGLGAVVALVLL